MQKSNGRIIGSLVLSMIFILLLPVSVFGNLFVVAFPSKRLKTSAAKSIPIPKPIVNISADSTDQDGVGNEETAKAKIHLDGVEVGHRLRK